MKYSYEYKKNCVELYRQGKWPETPDGIKQENFRISVRRWSRREKSCGTESLQKNQKKMWSADEKYELIAKVLAGVSITESAISAGVEPSLLSQWVRCYKMKGYQGLAAQRKGRPPKEPDMKKKIVPAELTPSEREELIRLRAENEYLRTENEVIKKRIALRQEKFAAQLKAKKLHSSTNSEEKDTL
jgi:transposase